MNRDSRILIYGSFVIMLGMLAASLVCGCDRMVGETLALTAVAFGTVGMAFAGLMERYDLHSAA